MLRTLTLLAPLVAVAVMFVALQTSRLDMALLGDRWSGRLHLVRAGLRFRLALFRATGDLGSLYFRRGKSNAFFLLTIAGAAGPTLAEITAGTELSAAVGGMSGWETSLNRVNQPVLKYVQDYQVPGPQQYGDAQMTFIDDDGLGSDTDSTARQAVSTAMVVNTTGFIVLSPKKLVPIAGTKVHVFPVLVGARNDAFTLDAELAKYVVDFAISGAARKDVAVT